MKNTVQLPDQSADFRNLVDLLAVLGEATDRLNALQTALNEETRSLVDQVRADYTDLQTKISQSEEAIQTLCNRNKWFEKSKTLKTPYGACSVRDTTSIVAASEDAAIILIRQAGRADDFLRTTVELDLEALEKLDDHELHKFGLVRAKSRKLTIKPAKVDLGEAVKEEAAKAA